MQKLKPCLVLAFAVLLLGSFLGLQSVYSQTVLNEGKTTSVSASMAPASVEAKVGDSFEITVKVAVQKGGFTANHKLPKFLELVDGKKSHSGNMPNQPMSGLSEQIFTQQNTLSCKKDGIGNYEVTVTDKLANKKFTIVSLVSCTSQSDASQVADDGVVSTGKMSNTQQISPGGLISAYFEPSSISADVGSSFEIKLRLQVNADLSSAVGSYQYNKGHPLNYLSGPDVLPTKQTSTTYYHKFECVEKGKDIPSYTITVTDKGSFLGFGKKSDTLTIKFDAECKGKLTADTSMNRPDAPSHVAEKSKTKYAIAFSHNGAGADGQGHDFIILFDGSTGNVVGRGLSSKGFGGAKEANFVNYAGGRQYEPSPDVKKAHEEAKKPGTSNVLHGSGVIQNESVVGAQLSLYVEITKEEYDKIVDYINSYDRSYNLACGNCATFVIDVAKQLGISLGSGPIDMPRSINDLMKALMINPDNAEDMGLGGRSYDVIGQDEIQQIKKAYQNSSPNNNDNKKPERKEPIQPFRTEGGLKFPDVPQSPETQTSTGQSPQEKPQPTPEPKPEPKPEPTTKKSNTMTPSTNGPLYLTIKVVDRKEPPCVEHVRDLGYKLTVTQSGTDVKHVKIAGKDPNGKQIYPKTDKTTREFSDKYLKISTTKNKMEITIKAVAGVSYTVEPNTPPPYYDTDVSQNSYSTTISYICKKQEETAKMTLPERTKMLPGDTVTKPADKTKSDGKMNLGDKILSDKILADGGSKVGHDGVMVGPGGLLVGKDWFGPGTIIRSNGDAIFPDGSIRHSDGSTTIQPGGIKITPTSDKTKPQSRWVHKDGSITIPKGPTIHPDGSVTYPNGVRIFPGGKIQHPDGTTIHPDGTVTKPFDEIELPGSLRYPPGTKFSPDGVVTFPDGTKFYDEAFDEAKQANKAKPGDKPESSDNKQTNDCKGCLLKPGPDGIIHIPGGTIKLPDHTVIYPDGRVVLPDGTTIDTDGIIHTTDGRVIYPDGTVVYPNGVRISPDGNMHIPSPPPLSDPDAPRIPQGQPKPPSIFDDLGPQKVPLASLQKNIDDAALTKQINILTKQVDDLNAELKKAKEALAAQVAQESKAESVVVLQEDKLNDAQQTLSELTTIQTKFNHWKTLWDRYTATQSTYDTLNAEMSAMDKKYPDAIVVLDYWGNMIQFYEAKRAAGESHGWEISDYRDKYATTPSQTWIVETTDQAIELCKQKRQEYVSKMAPYFQVRDNYMVNYQRLSTEASVAYRTQQDYMDNNWDLVLFVYGPNAQQLQLPQKAAAVEKAIKDIPLQLGTATDVVIVETGKLDAVQTVLNKEKGETRTAQNEVTVLQTKIDETTKILDNTKQQIHNQVSTVKNSNPETTKSPPNNQQSPNPSSDQKSSKGSSPRTKYCSTPAEKYLPECIEELNKAINKIKTGK